MFDKFKKKLDKAIHGGDSGSDAKAGGDDATNAGATVIKSSKKRTPYGFDCHDNSGTSPYQWPTLYEEADEMLQLSLLIYTITDLRSIAKKPKLAKQLQDPDKILKLPLSLVVFLQVLQENLDFIQKQVGDDDHKMTMSALSSIQQRIDRLKISSDEPNASIRSTSSTTSGTTGGGSSSIASSIFQQWFQPLFLLFGCADAFQDFHVSGIWGTAI